MAAVALIQINQGGGVNTDIAGRAVKGTTTDGTVVFSNGDNSDVATWTFELLDVPPGSAIPKDTQGPGAVQTFTMAQPDVSGSYRMRLTVADSSGNTNTDIRNLVVPFSGTGILAPPFQGEPKQLPLVGALAKPNELNIGGQAFGWAGDDDSSRIFLYQTLQLIDQGLGPLTIRDRVAGQYSGTAVPSLLGVPHLVRSARTVQEVSIVRRTAGTAGTTRVDVLVDGVSIFANDGDKPQVTAASGDDASNVTTTILNPNVTAGQRIDFELETVETVLVGPPAGPADFEVAIVLAPA